MENWAVDDSHGYDQRYRWGEYGDYDCSSAVIQAYENAGVLVKTNGARSTWNMVPVFLATGFEDVTSEVNLNTQAGLRRGDVLYVHNSQRQHVAMYCGNGLEVEASINEFGDVVGGQPGDQTGTEFLIQPYRNIWERVFRLAEDPDDTVVEIKIGDDMYEFKELRLGNVSNKVRLWQILLRGYKILGEDGKEIRIDGKFGFNVLFATKTFQKKKKLKVTGVVDEATWKKAMKL